MAFFDLMSVREMIDSAFGEIDSSCPVDFHMFGSVLFILARRMQLLKRNFKVQMSEALKKDKRRTRYVVTEIKIRAKKKRAKANAGERLPSDKRDTGKIKRSTRKRSRTTSLHRTPSAKHAGDESSSGTSSDGDVFTTKSAAHKRSSKKYTYAKKSHAERRIDEDYAKDMSPDARSLLTAKQRESRMYSDEMSPTRLRKRGKYSDETSVSDRRKARKYSDEIMTFFGQRKSGKYSDDMSPDERKKYSGKTSPAERRGGKYRDQTSPFERSKSFYSPTDEFSSESAISGKSRSEKRSTHRGKADEFSSESAISGKSRSEKRSTERGKDTAGRWKETRNNERKSRYGARHTDYDSDDMEEQHEKIFVVARTPSGREIRESALVSPVATQAQFNRLLERTRELQAKLGLTEKSNAKWDDLRNSTSITDPKAAMNMAVRLDVAQARLASMLDVVKEMALQVPGKDVEANPDVNHRYLNVAGPLSTSASFTTRDQHLQTSDDEPEYYYVSKDPVSAKPNADDNVTHGQFAEELRKTRDGIAKTVHRAIDKAGFGKFGRSLSSTEAVVNQFDDKFSDVDKLNHVIDEFGRKLVAVDERLTFEMTTFQDNLMEMQTELEVAVDKMTDSFLAPKEDPSAVALITGEFIHYNEDLDSTGSMQILLKGQLEDYQKDLNNVKERIKVLQNDKCTRDEMFEALNDKVTVKDINGLLTESQFIAVTTEMKKVLHDLYLSIFTKECSWQRIIDELKGEINENVDKNQLNTLMDSMGKCFTTMDKRMDDMFAVVGPLRISPTDKTVTRDNYCLCCGAPAEPKKTKLGLKFWQEALSKSDAVESPNEEIAVLCIPGQPIPHPLDQDSFVCDHDCGDTVKSEAVFDLHIKELTKTRKNADNSVAAIGKEKTLEDHEIA